MEAARGSCGRRGGGRGGGGDVAPARMVHEMHRVEGNERRRWRYAEREIFRYLEKFRNTFILQLTPMETPSDDGCGVPAQKRYRRPGCAETKDQSVEEVGKGGWRRSQSASSGFCSSEGPPLQQSKPPELQSDLVDTGVGSNVCQGHQQIPMYPVLVWEVETATSQ